MRLLGWMTVVVLCCAARAAAGQDPSDARLREAEVAEDVAGEFYDAGKYPQALALSEHALTLREAALGKGHPAVAGSLTHLASVYKKAGLYDRAEPLYERALAIREAALGKNHLAVAASLDGLASLYMLQGMYGRAEPLYQRALVIAEAALGKNHPDVASLLNNLANLYQAQGVYSRAESLYQRALVMKVVALGKDHPAVALSLGNLANLYAVQGMYGRAEPLYQRALAIREAALGKNHPDVSLSLNNLADLYTTKGMYSRAEPLYLRALAIQEAALGKDHPALATSLHNLANLYRAQGFYTRAEPLYTRALAIQEAALGGSHPAIATSLNNLASLYMAQGLYDRAKPLYMRALALSERVLDEHHPNIAQSLQNLASLYVAQGLYDQAEPLCARSLSIWEASLGKNHPDVARSLNNLANLYQAQGLYDRAEPIYERALAIQEAALGKNHPDVALSLNNLAHLYTEQGLYGRAQPLYERALAIREAALDKNHPDIAASLNNLATLYWKQGMYGRAEPLYQRALAIQEATLGKNHSAVAASLNNLAALYQAQESYAQAEPLYQRALAIREATFGKFHPTVATLLNNLATLYMAQGQYARAGRLYRRALAIWETVLGENHPDLARPLNNLASLRLAQHRVDEALPLFTRAFAMSEQRLRHEALGFSEARLASFLQFLRTDEERLYALVRAYPDNVNARRMALGAALLLKGRSAEETADISRAVYRSLGEEEHATFERLRGLRTQLVNLSLQGPGSLSLTAYRQRIQELTEQGDALEATLARRSAPLRALAALPIPAEIVDRVAAALPKDGALVEFITYVDRPLVPESSAPESQLPGQLRYLALVLLPDATIHVLDLGPAEPIDLAITRLRDALANRDAAYQAHAQALYPLVFQPLLPLLGKTRRLFLSPDGQLALVPFAALHDGHHFLVERFDFTYLTSGKDLLPRPQETVPATTVVVLADPDFGAPLPLPGTRREAEAIQRLLPQAQLFLGAEASKERLLHLPTPGILHLATHGFFLEDATAPSPSRAVGHFGVLGEDTQVPRPPSPLLRSGLLFAGDRAQTSATSSPSAPRASLVTALELADLNLWGTQLVVLSACDTGRGDIQLGQGVYGLRRAFVVAGAETVVMSLWKVNDETTQALMKAYYRNLLAGQGRAAALRQAMRWLRATRPHPHEWAPFIALGSDAPLRLPGTAPVTPAAQRGPPPAVPAPLWRTAH